MDKEKLLDLLDRQTFAYHEMQPESPEDYTAEYKKGYNEGLKFAIAYIDQLDEPEVLSQEWIEEKSYDRLILEGTMDDEDETFVSSYDLQNLLVPKQEEAKEPEKVVVPEFVAEWIEILKTKGLKPLKNPETYGETGFTEEKLQNIVFWISEYQEDYMRAWLDGYTVEKPQLFYLKNKLTGMYLYKKALGGYGEDPSSSIKYLTDDFKFTQQEIDSMETESYEQIEVIE